MLSFRSGTFDDRYCLSGKTIEPKGAGMMSGEQGSHDTEKDSWSPCLCEMLSYHFLYTTINGISWLFGVYLKKKSSPAECIHSGNSKMRLRIQLELTVRKYVKAVLPTVLELNI